MNTVLRRPLMAKRIAEADRKRVDHLEEGSDGWIAFRAVSVLDSFGVKGVRPKHLQILLDPRDPPIWTKGTEKSSWRKKWEYLLRKVPVSQGNRGLAEREELVVRARGLLDIYGVKRMATHRSKEGPLSHTSWSQERWSDALSNLADDEVLTRKGRGRTYDYSLSKDPHRMLRVLVNKESVKRLAGRISNERKPRDIFGDALDMTASTGKGSVQGTAAYGFGPVAGDDLEVLATLQDLFTSLGQVAALLSFRPEPLPFALAVVGTRSVHMDEDDLANLLEETRPILAELVRKARLLDVCFQLDHNGRTFSQSRLHLERHDNADDTGGPVGRRNQGAEPSQVP